MLGLRFCARAFSSCGKRGLLFIAVRGPLTIVASFVAEHRLQKRRLSSCGSRAQLLRGMWDLPRPGLEPVSPALAGRFSTTASPGKPCLGVFEHPSARALEEGRGWGPCCWRFVLRGQPVKCPRIISLSECQGCSWRSREPWPACEPPHTSCPLPVWEDPHFCCDLLLPPGSIAGLAHAHVCGRLHTGWDVSPGRQGGQPQHPSTPAGQELGPGSGPLKPAGSYQSSHASTYPSSIPCSAPSSVL